MDPESRIQRGKAWPAPAGAVRVRTFEIYRYDPDSGENPRLDTFEVDLDDCGPMVLDALFWIKNKVELDTYLPSLVPRGHLRFLLHEHRWRELARLHTVHFRLGHTGDDLSAGEHADHQGFWSPISLICSRSMRLSSLGSNPRRRILRRNGSSRRRSGARSMAITNASSASVARRAARAIGGTATVFWDPPCSCRLGAGWLTAATREPASDSTTSKTRSGSIDATPFSIAPGLVRRASIPARPSPKSRRC